MDFRDLNGERLSVGDPVTLVGEYLDPRYLDGANGTITKLGQSLVKVSVRNLQGDERERSVRPSNLRKGHHGRDPGEGYEAAFGKAFAAGTSIHVRSVLDHAVRERLIDDDQRHQLDRISNSFLAPYLPANLNESD